MLSRLPVVRRGMTLIELLVVVVIMLTLVITVAPNLVNTAEARRGREAARMVAGMVAKAQSRALGRAEWSGMMLLATSTTSFAAIDMVLADVPPAYRGDTTDATITIAESGKSRRTGTPSAGALTNVLAVGGTTSDLIRFAGCGRFYELVFINTTSSTIRMLGSDDKLGQDAEDLGYTSHNTPWPPPVPLAFEIFRRPAPAGSPLSLPENRVVDLRWSGVGPPQVDGMTDTYRQFGRSGFVSSVSLVFDGTGRLRQALAGSTRLIITGPVFLLIGRPDRLPRSLAGLSDPLDPNQPANLNPADDSTGANWQYADSHWVAIDPMTGVAKTAECFPGAASVIDSQRWVRDALLTTGR